VGQSKHRTGEIDPSSKRARPSETREGGWSALWERLSRSTHPKGCGESDGVDQLLFSTGLDGVQSYPGRLPIYTAWEERPVRSKPYGDQRAMEQDLGKRASTA
jgi:hypothetical protein